MFPRELYSKSTRYTDLQYLFAVVVRGRRIGPRLKNKMEGEFPLCITT